MSDQANTNRRLFLKSTASIGVKVATVSALLSALTSKSDASGLHSDPDCFPSASSPVCLLRDTFIATDVGDVPVQDLRVGDMVITASGSSKPLKWLGRMSYARSPGAAFSRETLPIRIVAGALSDNVPSRDLYVSPLHALFIDDALIRARDLVNGLTILEAMPNNLERLEYFNLEFDSHEVIYAEGAAVESFQACGQREHFENFAEYARLYGDDALEMPPCAPIHEYYNGRAEAAAVLRRVSTQIGLDLRDPLQVRFDMLLARAQLLSLAG